MTARFSILLLGAVLLQIPAGWAQERHGFARVFGLPPFVLNVYQQPTDSPDSTRVEVYVGIVNDVLQFALQESGGYRAGYEMSLDILDSDDNQVDGRTLSRWISVTTFEETNSRSRYNTEVAQFVLAPGSYRLYLDVMDRETRKHLRRDREMEVENFSGEFLKISTLMLQERAATENTPPTVNLTGIYLRPDRLAQVRFWVCGLAVGDSFRVRYRLTDWRQHDLATWDSTMLASTANILFEEALQPHLPGPGRYVLVVQVQQGDRQAEQQQRLSVQYSNSTVSTGEQDLFEQKILEEVGPLQYILPKEVYRKLLEADSLERQRRIEAFWKERDPTPDTPENELRQEFQRRVAFANAHFSVLSVQKAGWQTDRGRIYITFGPPDWVQRPTQFGEAPVEVWFYRRIDRRFVFRDKHENGDYVLVYEE